MAKRGEKAAATRQNLMDATFACLTELGYHGTSTAAVCRRANLARGTMLHHFPNKDALVLAALEDVLVRRVAQFQRELSSVDTRDTAQLVRSLWAAIQGPTFIAWLELAVASRTHQTLAPAFRALMSRFEKLVNEIVRATFPPDSTRDEDLVLEVSLVFTALNGLALDLLQTDIEVVERKVAVFAQWIEALHAR